MLVDKVHNIAGKNNGKLIVKEYPTGSAHTGHFRALLNELKLKRDFVPEMIFIDYLNICASSRMKGMGGSINSYTYIKLLQKNYVDSQSSSKYRLSLQRKRLVVVTLTQMLGLKTRASLLDYPQQPT